MNFEFIPMLKNKIPPVCIFVFCASFIQSVFSSVPPISENTFNEISPFIIKYKEECQSVDVINKHSQALAFMKSKDSNERKKGAEIWLKLYGSGDAIAGDFLSEKYYYGDTSIGIERDLNKSLISEENSAKKGFPMAVLQMARFFQYRESNYYDPKMAYVWSMVGLKLTSGQVSVFSDYVSNSDFVFKSDLEKNDVTKHVKDIYKNILEYKKSNCTH